MRICESSADVSYHTPSEPIVIVMQQLLLSDEELEVELTEQEFHYAIKMTDVSIR